MAFWNLLRRRRGGPLSPERRWTLSLQDGLVELSVPDGKVQRVPLDELTGIAVETNDTGPGGSDVWWLLFGKDQKVAVAYPQGATGEKAILDTLMALPDFDHQAMLNAMTCTSNRIFPLWQAPGLDLSAS